MTRANERSMPRRSLPQASTPWIEIFSHGTYAASEREQTTRPFCVLVGSRSREGRFGRRTPAFSSSVTRAGRVPGRLRAIAPIPRVVARTGAGANVAADRRLEGPITAQIDLARRLLRRWLPRAIRLQVEGRFGSATLIPEFVWLEGVVNAVTHRSYSIGGDHVRVELFDDRLEVESPGRLPGLVRVDNIRSTRFARNPRIARALSDLGYGRELGEGVNRMFEEMNRAGLPDPVYVQGPASVAVILLADPMSRRILDRLPPTLRAIR
jgi:Putative ATP-dependent DNA helicase recG C-terminal